MRAHVLEIVFDISFVNVSMEAAAMRSQPATNRPDAYWPHNSSACGIFRYLSTSAIFQIMAVLLRKK